MDNYTREDKNARIQIPICDRTQSTDLTVDVSLPDYQPEIKRLLRVRAIAHPADKYVGSGNAELSGSVDYVILYAGNDNALYSTVHTGEYSFTFPMESGVEYDLSDGILCDALVRAESVSGRVVSPRKLAIKCRLRSCVKLYAGRMLPDAIRTEDPTVQTLKGSTECVKVFLGTSEAIRLSDEILCDAQANDLRVILAEGEVFVSEAVAGSGEVNCRGEVCLKLLTVQETGGMPTTMQRRIPFSQSIAVEGTEVNCDCIAHGCCTEINVSVEEGRILCDVAVILQVYAQRNEEIRFLRDVYSTEQISTAEEMTCALEQALHCMNGNFSLNQTLKLADVGIRSEQTVIDVCATALSPTIEQESGKLWLQGKCRCHAILWDGEEMSAQEFELPYRYEVGATKGKNASDHRANVDVILCRARVDGERISVDAELAVSLATVSEQRIKMISEAKFGERINRSGSVYTVCYPSSDDTLWSVAKRYHRPVTAISEINSLAGAPAADSKESLEGVSYLLV